jgi:hypothetical protein
MKNLALAALLTISSSSLFAQKQKHDETLVFGNYIYTDKATGKKWGAADSVVSDQWTIKDNRDQLAYGELFLNNASHDTLKNVVFYYFIESIRDSREVRTVDTTARIITSYNFSDITGFHVGRAIKVPGKSDTGRFYSVSRKGMNTLQDGRMDIAQAFFGSPKFMLLLSVRLPYFRGNVYYRLANMPEFAEMPLYGEQRFGYSFKKQFARIFEGCPAMQQMVKDKNYPENLDGLIAAFRDYNSLNCPDNAAAAN